jgi:chorismate dehydratase
MIARIGMVNYINTAPIYEIWKEDIHEPDWQVTEAPPSTLNRLLASDQLDLGFVSSYEYALRPEQYRVMSDLSISATGPVGSVFLFARVPIADLDQRLVLLTGQSDTSICLARIILEEFHGLRPRYATGDIMHHDPEHEEIGAVLAIGDDALRLSIADTYPFRLDLGEAWHRATGLPFVFAVCAVRESFLQRQESQARAILQSLWACRDKGARNLAAICQRVADRIPMDCEACSCYLHAIQYDLSPAKQQALERFFALLIERGEADARALPLKFFA